MGTWVQKWFLVILLLLITSVVDADSHDYTRLIFKLEEKKNKDEEPLYVFSTVEGHSDRDIHQQNLNYFDKHPDLIRKIQSDLKCKQLDWQLRSTRQNLLFVPEKEGEFARLYKDYCIQSIHYILTQTGFSNPYEKIIMLQQEKPRLPPKGIRAYLVQNLVKEVVATYLFSSPDKRSIMLKIEIGKKKPGRAGIFFEL